MNKTYLNLDITYDYAVKKLASKDPQEMASNAGVTYDAHNKIFTVPYMENKYTVSYPDGAVSFVDRQDEVVITEKILILHYLAYANGVPIQNKWISFKELPDGAIYIDPFTRRTINPMVKVFGDNQEKFVEMTKYLNPKKETLGDTSLTIYAFPRVPVTYILYSGDDEFPASGNVLFDASAPNYLPTEDFAFVASLPIHRLCALAQQDK